MAEPSKKAFKTSDIEVNYPNRLQGALQEQLERVKAVENEANEKLQALLKKEKALEETRLRLEQEQTESRAGIQKQLDALKAQHENENDLARKEITRLKSEMESVQREYEAIRNERNSILTEYEERKTALERAFVQREKIFKEKFDELSGLIQATHDDEKKFIQLKNQEHQRFKTKEKRLKEATDQMMKKVQEIDRQNRVLEANKKKYKALLQKQYDEKQKELQKDFHRRSEYHRRRLDDEEKEKDWLVDEKNKLVIKEQTLNLELQRKTDEHFKKQQAELEKREKEVDAKGKELAKEEQALIEEKEKLLARMKAQSDGKVALAELKTLVEEQQKIVDRKKKFLKTLEEERVKANELAQETTKRLEQEKKDMLARLEDERKTLREEFKRLKDKEQDLIVRETEELARLNDEYENLRNSLEVEQIEKDEEADKAREKLQEMESRLLAKQKELLEKDIEAGKRNEAAELEILEHLNETFKTKEELAQHQETVRQFLDNFHSIYQERLEYQNMEFDAFKKHIKILREDAERARQTLAEKEKTVREESAATLQAFGERLKQREGMVDEMEKDLKERLQEYQTFVKELQQAKEEIVVEDQNRKSELLENLSHYEDKLIGLARAFEDLSDAFKREKERGRIEPPREDNRPLAYDEDLAKMEWSLAVRNRLEPAATEERSPIFTEFLYKFAGEWDQWISVPPGKFWMGNNRSPEAAPYHEAVVEKAFFLKKYPVTNIEFFQFVNETNYRTEAESGVVPIVYHDGQDRQRNAPDRHSRTYSNPTLAPMPGAFWLRPDGRPDSLNEKYGHPVTQVTWNDAQAYCAWKSEATGKKFRLPTETEWEYVAGNFGKAGTKEFYWDANETSKFCNVEETGIGDTTPVDFFPENPFTGGAQDLFGNVYEWTLDTHRGSGKAGKLVYKLARGGSFITPFKHIAPWRRLPFAINYSASFLGFRVAFEET